VGCRGPNGNHAQVAAHEDRCQDEPEQRTQRVQRARPLLGAGQRELDGPADRHEQ